MSARCLAGSTVPPTINAPRLRLCAYCSANPAPAGFFYGSCGALNAKQETLRPASPRQRCWRKQGGVNKAAHRQWRQADNRKNGCVKHSTPASRAERTPPGKHYRSEQASRAATSLFPCFIVNSHNVPWLIKAKINIVTQNTTKHANRYLSGFMPFTPCLSASKRLISTCRS